MRSDLPSLRDRSWAVLAVIGASAAALLYYLLPLGAFPAPESYMSRVADLWHAPFFNSIPQSRSYRLFLLALASISLVAACLRGSPPRSHLLGSLPRWTPWLAGLLFLYPLAAGSSPTTMGANGRELMGNVAASVILVVLLGAAFRYFRAGALKTALGVLLVVYAAALLIPGFFLPLALNSESFLREVDWHFDAVMGGAEQIRDGLRVFTDVRPLYGVLGPGFIAILEKLFGQLDFGAHVRLVQISQAAFFILAMVNCWLWMRRPILFMLVAALLVGPYLGTSHGAILLPNQSGWRYFGVGIAILFLMLGKRIEPNKHAFCLGLLTGALNLHSPEISIVVSGGLFVFLITASGAPLRFRPPLRLLFFVLGIAGAWGAYFLIHRLAFGAFPTQAHHIFDTILRIAHTGFSGSPLYFDPAFVFIASLSAYRCSTLFIKATRQGLRSNEQIMFAISVMSLLWLPYFVNRADAWNLWAELYFMLFLLPRGLFAMPSRLGPSRASGATSIQKTLRVSRTACLYALFLGPLMVNANRTYFSIQRTMWSLANFSLPPSQRPVVSGVIVSSTAARLLQQRSNYLQAHKSQNIHCVTKLPFTLRLLVGSPRAWITNPFIHWSREDFPSFTKNVLHRSPDLILFDSPDDGVLNEGPTLEKTWQSLCALFRKRISHKYRQTQTSDGWEIWEKIPNNPAPE